MAEKKSRKRVVPLAKASPSGASRWLTCHGFLQGAADCPEGATNTHAALGTAAHTLLEQAIRLRKSPAEWQGDEINGFVVDEDMLGAVEQAYYHITEWTRKHKGSFHRVEYGMSIVLGGTTITGTADFVGYSPKADLLTVIDYKHGSGIYVSEKSNPQIGLYALGALQKLGKPVKHVEGVIIQPRVTHRGVTAVRPQVLTPEYLRELEAKAIEALEAAKVPGAKRTAGRHCKWCPLAATCVELAEYNIRNAVEDFEDISTRPVINPKNVQELTMDGLAYLLEQMPVIKSWVSAVDTEALRRLQAGAPVPGYKLVPGRSYRQWSSDVKVSQVLRKAGVSEDDFAPRVLKSPAQVHKLIKADKPLLKRIDGLIVKTTPSLHVAPESDPRGAIGGKAALDFVPVNADGTPRHSTDV